MKSKISAFNKTIIALYAILGAVLTLFFVIAFYCEAEISVFGYVFKLAGGIWPRISVGIAGAVMLIWSYWILATVWGRRSAIDRSSVSISNTENGDVRISLQAMDSLVKRAIGDLSGIASIKTNVLGNDDSISVEVSMALESDVHIPNATMLLQRTVKNFIEEYSGIAVRDVTVIVTSVADPIVVPKQLAIETLPKKTVKEEIEATEAKSAVDQPIPDTAVAENEEVSKAIDTESKPDTVIEADDEFISNETDEVDETVCDSAPVAQEPERETEQLGTDNKEYDTYQDISDSSAQPDEAQAPVEDDFLISDGLPKIDDYIDQTDNVDANFYISPESENEEAKYYSPFEDTRKKTDNEEKQ